MTETESESEMMTMMVTMRGLQSIPIYMWNHPGKLTKSFTPTVLQHWLLLPSLTLTRPSVPPPTACSRRSQAPVLTDDLLPTASPELSETPQKTFHGVSNPHLFREGSFYCLSLDKIWIPPEGTFSLQFSQIKTALTLHHTLGPEGNACKRMALCCPGLKHRLSLPPKLMVTQLIYPTFSMSSLHLPLDPHLWNHTYSCLLGIAVCTSHRPSQTINLLFPPPKLF